MNTATLDYSELRIINNRIRRTKQLRRRVLIFILSSVILISLFSILVCSKSFANSKDNVVLYKYYKTVEVSFDDTLSTISDKYISESQYTKDKYDKAEFIEELMYINNIDEPTDLRLGSYIIIPYYDVYQG